MCCYYAASFQSYIYLTDHFTDTSASLKLYLEKTKTKRYICFILRSSLLWQNILKASISIPDFWTTHMILQPPCSSHTEVDGVFQTSEMLEDQFKRLLQKKMYPKKKSVIEHFQL